VIAPFPPHRGTPSNPAGPQPSITFCLNASSFCIHPSSFEKVGRPTGLAALR
jgi:hypothetical protein